MTLIGMLAARETPLRGARGRRRQQAGTTAISANATQTAMAPGSPVTTAATASSGLEMAIEPSVETLVELTAAPGP